MAGLNLDNLEGGKQNMEKIHFGLDNKSKDINFTLDGKLSPTKIKDSTPTGLFIDPKKVCSNPNARSC